MTDNLDDKVNEFYEFKGFTDLMTGPIVRETIHPAQIDPTGKPRPRMLFLDDRTKRIEAARKKYAQQYDVTYVHNVKECLRYLCRQEFDIVSLDHDLNGDDFQNPDDVTSGMEVVRYIVKCGGFPPSQIVVPEVWIHSSNLLAANLMVSELLKVGIPAYFRRFEYDDEKKACNCKEKICRKPYVPDDDWRAYTCLNCTVCKKHEAIVNKDGLCWDCYERELISSSGMSVADYWAMKKCRQ